jgi:hypothetical protein
MSSRRLARTTRILPPAAARMGDRQALNETFEKAHGEVELLRQQGAIVAYRLGERLCTIRDLELFREGGFDSFKSYLLALKGASIATYYRCIARYSAVSGELAKRIDPERLDIAARLLPHKKGEEPNISEKSLAALEVPVKRDGKTTKVKFFEATTDELAEAAKRKAASGRASPSEGVRASLARLEKRFDNGSGAVAGVRFARQGNRHGVAIFVPEDRLAAFEKLLKK